MWDASGTCENVTLGAELYHTVQQQSNRETFPLFLEIYLQNRKVTDIVLISWLACGFLFTIDFSRNAKLLDWGIYCHPDTLKILLMGCNKRGNFLIFLLAGTYTSMLFLSIDVQFYFFAEYLLFAQFALIPFQWIHRYVDGYTSALISYKMDRKQHLNFDHEYLSPPKWKPDIFIKNCADIRRQYPSASSFVAQNKF